MSRMNYYPLPPEVTKIPLDDYTGVLSFSGGVESTALMAHVKASGEKFVALNFAVSLAEPPYGPVEVWLAKQRINARQIAAAMDVPLLEVDFQATNLMTVRPEQPSYKYSFQRFYISWLLGLMTVYNPGIKNLYYGLNSDDSSARIPELRQRLVDMIRVMSDDAELCTPLMDKTKAEQWELIPDHVKPLVLTCYNGVCGECFKCRERLENGIPLK